VQPLLTVPCSFLDSLIFNNQVDAYKPWILFLVFTSIVILISGVVLLTHKKPERSQRNVARSRPVIKDDRNSEAQALRGSEEGESPADELWQLGDMSDDEDGADADTTKPASRGAADGGVEEGRRLIEEEDMRRSSSSDATLARNDSHDEHHNYTI
jgi:hypothetical protein